MNIHMTHPGLYGHVTYWKMGETQSKANGTSVDEQYSYGRSRLMIASANGDTQTVKSLLDEGAQVNLKDNGGASALQYACSGGVVFHDDKADWDGDWSKLKMSHLNDQSDIVKVLLDHDAQVDLQDENGWSALLLASGLRQLKIVHMLLDAGADVDLQSKIGVSALMFANYFGHTEVARVLLDRGAQVGLQDEDDDSAASGPSEHDKPVKLPQRTDSEMSPQEETSVILEKHTAQITENTTQIKELKAMFASMQLKFGNLQPIKNNPSHYPTSLTLRDVYRELLPLASKWNEIGILLNIKPEQLNRIESNHPNDVNRCLSKTIKEWLNGIDPRPTWEELVEAVKLVNGNRAEDIRIKYCTQ